MKKSYSFVFALGAMLLMSLSWVLMGSSGVAVAESEATGIIKGRVRAADAGDIGLVKVRASPPGEVSTMTDASGFYTLTLPVNPDGYELQFDPVPGKSFMLSKLTPGRIYFSGGEVKAGVDITMDVGGTLGGTLLDAVSGLPTTVSVLAIAGVNFDPAIDQYYPFDVLRGVINSGQLIFPAGRYTLRSRDSLSEIQINKRAVTTLNLAFDHFDPGLADVMTIAGMPNFIGLRFGQANTPMLYSLNAGSTWKIFWQPDVVPDGETNRNTLLAGHATAFTRRGQNETAIRAVSGRTPAVLEGSKQILMRSGDDGETWADAAFAPTTCADLAPSNAQTATQALLFKTVKTSPVNPRHLYATGTCAFVGENSSTFTSFDVIYASEDFGLSWQRRRALVSRTFAWAPSLTQEAHVFLTRYGANNSSTDPITDSLIIEESSDAGRTWVSQTTALSRKGFGVVGLVADGSLSRTLYLYGVAPVSSFDSKFQLLMSNDAGSTWMTGTVPGPCPTNFGPDVLSVRAILGKAGHLLLTCFQENYLSRDGGQSWQKFAPTTPDVPVFVDYANPGRLYSFRYRGGFLREVWASDDEGESWRPVWNVPGAHTLYLPIAHK